MVMAQSAQAAETSVAQDWPWARLTAAAGIAFVALTIVGLTLPGADPTPDVPLASVRAHFVENRTGVLAGVYLQNLGMLCFVLFAAGFGGLVQRRGGDPWGILARLMVAGAVGTAAITMVVNMAGSALAYRIAADGEAGAVQALFDFYLMVPVSSMLCTLFMAAAAVGIVRSAVAPRWLGWVALPPALFLLVSAAGLGDVRGPIYSAGYFGGLLPFILWMLVLSVVLLVRRETVAPATQGRMAPSSSERWQPEA
jgi:hypothetical protein